MATGGHSSKPPVARTHAMLLGYTDADFADIVRASSQNGSKLPGDELLAAEAELLARAAAAGRRVEEQVVHLPADVLERHTVLDDAGAVEVDVPGHPCRQA